MNLNSNFFITILIVAFCFSSLNCFTQDVQKFPEVKKLEAFPKTEFLPTLEHPINKDKNCIYAASLLYCWDEIKKEVGEPIVIDKSFKDLILLNDSKSQINVLKPNEYIASVKIEKNIIIAKAEFSKSLPIAVKLDSFKDYLRFEDTKVSSFGLIGFDRNMVKSFKILYYKDDDNFIIKLNPKDEEHEIILYKSKLNLLKTMSEIITEMNTNIELGKKEEKNKDTEWQYYMQDHDELVIPKFNLSIEYENLAFSENNFRVKDIIYSIKKTYQKNSFLLDQNGAKVESSSRVDISIGIIEKDSHPFKTMKFDKPFLLVLKRTDNKNPYFAMWVANAELMEKEEPF